MPPEGIAEARAEHSCLSSGAARGEMGGWKGAGGWGGAGGGAGGGSGLPPRRSRQNGAGVARGARVAAAASQKERP